MTNKRLEAKRLVIYILLAYGISWIPAILMNYFFGFHEWFETSKYAAAANFVGFGPALANIFTRGITKDGWHDSMLHLNLKGNLRYYVTAVLGLPVIGVFQGILAMLTIGGGDWSGLGKAANFEELLSLALSVFSTAPLMFIITFGEEFGWRGYMNQKLEPLVGKVGTVLIGGVVWGMWHAELTVAGHNFGTDYPGYPYMGFLAMCVSCVSLGIILMWLTEKTNSVYPAAIMHAMNNFGGTFTSQIFLSGVPEEYSPTIPERMLLDIPLDVAALAILALMLLEDRKKAPLKVQSR